MQKTQTGLDILISSSDERSHIKGNIAYLGNQASVSNNLVNGLDVMVSLFGKRISKAFGPQHGFATIAQDNMIETPHDVHPIHGIPVYSLYSETRVPTEDMLSGVDSLVIDLQDVGTRVYTYIWTMFNIMEKVRGRDIKIIVLDRPNPVNGNTIQGNLPEEDFFSFVCMSKIPMRHSLTFGEMARWFQKNHFPDVDLHVVAMKGWERWMHWQDTGLHWLNPSPNLPTPEGCLVYPGSVLIEGTNLSEGRGTTRSLEMIGHPDIKPDAWKPELDNYLNSNGISGFVLRPVFFEPVFQKFKEEPCGGYQMHVIDQNTLNPWKLGQLLLSFLYERLDQDKFWNSKPYEYEFQGLAIDWINGTKRIRELIEQKCTGEQLNEIENIGMQEFSSLKKEIILYF